MNQIADNDEFTGPAIGVPNVSNCAQCGEPPVVMRHKDSGVMNITCDRRFENHTMMGFQGPCALNYWEAMQTAIMESIEEDANERSESTDRC